MSEAPNSRLPIWLIASLMANALLVGLFIGGGFGQRKAGPSTSIGGGEQALIRGIEQALPDDQRQTVRRAFRRAFSDSRDQRILVRDARRKLGRVLSADPYDAEAVRDTFKDLRDADSNMRARMHDVLAEQFGALSMDQRRAIVEDLSRRESRRGRGDRGDRDRRPPPPRPRD